jgi:hypothetical protein
VVILGVRRNFFKEVYQNDYHGGFCNRLEKWVMVIKKIGLTMALLHEKTIGGLPTTTKLFTPKSDLWCHFFEFFEKCDFFI